MSDKQYLQLSIAGACTVAILFWLGGYDFNVRGHKAVECAIASLFVGVAIFAFPRPL